MGLPESRVVFLSTPESLQRTDLRGTLALGLPAQLLYLLGLRRLHGVVMDGRDVRQKYLLAVPRGMG